MNNETTVQKIEIQTEDKENYRKKIHKLLDEWFDNISDDSHFDVMFTLQRNFQLSND